MSIKVVDALKIAPVARMELVFEYVSLPLRGYKPMSILQAQHLNKMVVIVFNGQLPALIHKTREKSHPLHSIMFSRLPKSMRKRIKNYVVLHASPIKMDAEQRTQYEEQLRSAIAAPSPWLAPAGFNRGKLNSMNGLSHAGT